MSNTIARTAIALGAKPDHAAGIAETCLFFDIDTPLRVQHFLAQLVVETGNFTRVRENMNYSAKRLAEVWPSRYATPETARLPVKHRQPNALALSLGGKPEAIANATYGGRMGNDQPGDGWRYIGRGDKQLTGKANYRAYSRDVYGDDRVLRDPAMLERAPDRSHSAGWYWRTAKLNQWADRDDVLAVSRGVNLGNPLSSATPNGLAERRAALAHIRRLWPDFTNVQSSVTSTERMV